MNVPMILSCISADFEYPDAFVTELNGNSSLLAGISTTHSLYSHWHGMMWPSYDCYDRGDHVDSGEYGAEPF